jgi:regulator of RNase E activity RraA
MDRPEPDMDVLAALRRIPTATLTTVLLKRGVRNVWMRGPRPLDAVAGRLVGPAFTLRFVPAREDLATPESWASPTSTRAAIEAMPAGAVVVVADAGGIRDAGIFGDILCARMHQRGVAGLVTDGAMRDVAGIRPVGLPLWCAGAAAPASIAALTFVGWQQPVGCGGVAVMPDDVVVADADGAIVVPRALAAAVAVEAAAQEHLEDWIMRQVMEGAALPGLYPPNEAARRRYAEETGGDS